MIDLNRKPTVKKHDPNAVELIGLIVTIAVWVYMILGAMM